MRVCALLFFGRWGRGAVFRASTPGLLPALKKRKREEHHSAAFKEGGKPRFSAKRQAVCFGMQSISNGKCSRAGLLRFVSCAERLSFGCRRKKSCRSSVQAGMRTLKVRCFVIFFYGSGQLFLFFFLLSSAAAAAGT